jgi:hypothetical protein
MRKVHFMMKIGKAHLPSALFEGLDFERTLLCDVSSTRSSTKEALQSTGLTATLYRQLASLIPLALQHFHKSTSFLQLLTAPGVSFPACLTEYTALIRWFMLHNALAYVHTEDPTGLEQGGPFEPLYSLWLACDPEAPRTCAGNEILLRRILTHTISAEAIVKGWGEDKEFAVQYLLQPSAGPVPSRVALLLLLLRDAAFEQYEKMLPPGLGRSSGEIEFLIGIIRAAPARLEVVANNFERWAVSIFSPEKEIRHLVVIGMMRMAFDERYKQLGYEELERYPDFFEGTAKPDPSICGPQLLKSCIGLLPRALDLIRAELHNQYRALELLDAIWYLAMVTDDHSHAPEIDAFFAELLEIAQPYDPHVRAALRILGNSALAASVLRPIPHGDSDLFNRAVQLLEFLLPALRAAGNLDTDKIQIFVSTFSFARPSLIFRFSAVREFTAYLAGIARETVLAVLDSHFEEYATDNLAMVTVVLEKCNERRPLLDHLALCEDFSIFNPDEMWRRCVELHCGPVIDLEFFVSQFGAVSLSKSTRKLAFDVIERLPWTEDAFTDCMMTNHICLGRKAALWLRLGYPLDSWDAQTVCRNSYKALGVLFDRLAEEEPDEFFEERAEELLSKSYQNTRDHPLITSRKKKHDGNGGARPLGVMSPRWLATGDRKLIAAPYIRYARAVMPRLGKEKVFEFMRGHALATDRSIRFLSDVLGDVRDNGLDATEFEGIFEGMRIIADLKPPFDRELLERFAGQLQDPEISARYEFPRREELIGLVLHYLEPDQA